MCFIKKTLYSTCILLNILSFISSQYYATADELRGLHNRRKRPNNNLCGRQIHSSHPENSKFLGLAYINVENTFNCGTGGHYTNTYGGGGGQNSGLFGGGGHHKPHRPFQNYVQYGGQDGIQDDLEGAGTADGDGVFGHKPNRPFAGLLNGISSGFGNTGSNDEAAGPGAAFGGILSTVLSNVGSFVSNNNPFHSSVNSPQTAVQDVPNDPVPTIEQDKLPFFSNYLFQKPQHENNPNEGLFFGLFDGSIINSHYKPTVNYRPTTSQGPAPISTEGIEPVHEDYDLITEAYSLSKPAYSDSYGKLRPGQYIRNPKRAIKEINQRVVKFLDLFLLL